MLTDQVLEGLLAQVAQQMPLLQKLVRARGRLPLLLLAPCTAATARSTPPARLPSTEPRLRQTTGARAALFATSPRTSPCAGPPQVDNIALLDLLCSFRTFAAQSPAELVRPKVEDGGPLAIVQVRGALAGGGPARGPG